MRRRNSLQCNSASTGGSSKFEFGLGHERLPCPVRRTSQVRLVFVLCRAELWLAFLSSASFKFASTEMATGRGRPSPPQQPANVSPSAIMQENHRQLDASYHSWQSRRPQLFHQSQSGSVSRMVRLLALFPQNPKTLHARVELGFLCWCFVCCRAWLTAWELASKTNMVV